MARVVSAGDSERKDSLAAFTRYAISWTCKGLRSIHRKKCRRSLTDSRKARGDGYANLTRTLRIDAPFQVLSRDISYIRTGEGSTYLCQIKDVKSGIVLAESMSERGTTPGKKYLPISKDSTIPDERKNVLRTLSLMQWLMRWNQCLQTSVA